MNIFTISGHFVSYVQSGCYGAKILNRPNTKVLKLLFATKICNNILTFVHLAWKLEVNQTSTFGVFLFWV